MSTWHQERGATAGGVAKVLPKLWHPTLWRSYNPKGHLCVMTHPNKEDCMAYCSKTGDVPVAPSKL